MNNTYEKALVLHALIEKSWNLNNKVLTFEMVTLASEIYQELSHQELRINESLKPKEKLK